MKIPVYSLLIIFFVGALCGYYSYTDKDAKSELNPMQGYYDSVVNVTNKQQKIIDSFERTIAKRDTVIIKQIQYVKSYSEGVYRLPSDSSYKLFIQWARMFRDSGERARYLHTDSTGLYQ